MTEKKYPPRVWIPVFSLLYSQSGEEFEPWESYRYGASRRFSFKYTKEAPEPFVSMLEFEDLLKKKNEALRVAMIALKEDAEYFLYNAEPANTAAKALAEIAKIEEIEEIEEMEDKSYGDMHHFLDDEDMF